MATIKKLPGMIENPLIVMESASKKGDIVIVTSELDGDGQPIIVAIHPDGSGQYNRAEISSNFVTSMYGREGFGNFIKSAISEDRVLYNNKKRTRSLFAKVRLELPELLTSDGFFKDSVTQRGVNVKKPTDAPDIRFSLKANRDLIKENAKLREVNQGLKDQLKTTEFAKVDKKAMDQFTKKLLKDYFSGADINEVREMLDDLYTYLANGENGEVSWDEAQRRAYEAAVAVLESASVLDDEMWQSYKGLRDHLRTTPIRIDKQDSSSLIGYENLEDFRKRNFGRLRIANDGTPVDVVYKDLAVRYPEFFDERTDMNPADQLLTIVEVLDTIQPVEVNPYSYNMRESATWLANDIMERFFELPQAKPTFADKADRMSTGLSDSEKAYLWYMDMQHKSDEPFDALDAGIDIDTYIRFKEFDSTVEADKDENGKSINGSKKEKLRNWLNENNVGQDAYNFFMYEVKGYKS